MYFIPQKLVKDLLSEKHMSNINFVFHQVYEKKTYPKYDELKRQYAGHETVRGITDHTVSNVCKCLIFGSYNYL